MVYSPPLFAPHSQKLTIFMPGWYVGFLRYELWGAEEAFREVQFQECDA